MYFTKGTINGKSTNFLVDTGATHVTMSGHKAKSLNIDFRKGVRSRAQTAAAVVPAWQVRLDTVEVGGIKLNNVSATVIAGDHPSEVLLGNSFLRHTQIEQDRDRYSRSAKCGTMIKPIIYRSERHYSGRIRRVSMPVPYP